jgi:hypothetical protein
MHDWTAFVWHAVLHQVGMIFRKVQQHVRTMFRVCWRSNLKSLRPLDNTWGGA